MPAPTRHSQQFRHRAEVAAKADTMKLSRAIVVVILMHVVAVGGVLAFSLLHEGSGEIRKTKEESGKKKEDLAKAARKTAPTQGLDAPARTVVAPPPAALPIPALAKPAPGDPLESEALAILQGGNPAKPASAGPRPAAATSKPAAAPAKPTAKPDVRQASNTTPRGKKEEPKSRSN